MEEWKDIKGYEVSSMGHIFSKTRELKMPNGGFKTIIGREIKQYKTKNGYCYVILGYTHNERKNYYVHRLVAEAFPEICGEFFEGCQVDHLDTNKENNNANNLRCVTPSENSNNPLTIKHQSEKKLGKKMPFGFAEKQRIIHLGKHHNDESKKKISESLKNNPKKSKQVLQYDLDGNFIKEYASSKEAERNGFKHNSINLCCKGIYKQHKGYRWSYKPL